MVVLLEKSEPEKKNVSGKNCVRVIDFA